ncbi:MAG: SIS domain-containing protein [Pseudomonadota bacterium]
MMVKTLMESEAFEAPAIALRQNAENTAVLARIVSRFAAAPPPFVATCARGSSDHAATYGQYMLAKTMGCAVTSFPPSLFSIYNARMQLQGVAFLVISQSGQSPDLLIAAEKAKQCGAFVVAIVNDTNSPLATLADDVLPIHAGPEHSVAATKSCIGAMAVLHHLSAVWSGAANMLSAQSALPEVLSDALEADWSAATAAMQPKSQAFIIGRGIGLSAAQEAALKLKETCVIQAAGFSAAEVKHGPMEIVEPGFPVLAALGEDAARPSVVDMSAQLAARGADVFSVGGSVEGAASLPFPKMVWADLFPLAFLQAFYLFANALSLARGYDPDNPVHLQKVTETI